MNRLLAIVVVIVLAVAFTFGQKTTGQRSARETIERFCKMDAEGAQLSAEGWHDIGELLVNHNLWYPRSSVLVVRQYTVHGPDLHGNKASFNVFYEVWGEIDSSLRFERLEGLVANRPTRKREYISVIRTEKYSELGSNGNWHTATGPAEWRLWYIPAAPYINVDTAIRYLEKARDGSSDPAVKKNAEQSIDELNALSGTNSKPTVSTQVSAKKSLLQYCTLQTRGRGLTPQGWNELQSFFVRREPWRRDKIVITRDVALSDAGVKGNRAELFAEYLYLGELDSSFRFTNKMFEGHSSTTPVKVRVPYKLVLGKQYWEPQGGVAAIEKSGPAKWRIDGSQPDQWITVEAAIAFLTQLANNTADERIRKNASASVVALKRLR